jgi:lysophospholipase L1-like esterase
MERAKGKPRITTVILSVILAACSLGFLGFYVIYPKCMHYYLIKLDYQVYGGMTDELKDSGLFEDLSSGKTVCFIGDSITYGTESFGIHWYEPLIPYITGKTKNMSYGGWTVSDILNRSGKIPEADVYVIAIGINDVIHPDSKKAAKTPEEFIERISTLDRKISSLNPDSKCYYISPWALPGWNQEFNNRRSLFGKALEKWCDETGHIFIDPEPVIILEMSEKGSAVFTKDGLHPNAENGVSLYSYAVLIAAHNQRISQK